MSVRPSSSSRAWRLRLLLLGAALLLALVLAFSGAGQAIDRGLDPLRYALVGRAPSGKVVVVEMDAASVAAIRRWPWSRHHYGRVVDRLRLAGAASIVFDVDFSSPSDPAGDRAFAAALGRAEGLVTLPTYAQAARMGDARQLDSLPLPPFRRHVALASVTMVPDPDGMVRHAPYGTVTAGVPRPSLSALIAERSGQAGAYFPIDFAIDADRVPRLSFIAVEQGRFDPAQVRGRQVLIGATAIEMGDRYGTPRWGVVPGVVVQALAAETLIRGVPVEGWLALPILVALLLALPVLLARTPRGTALFAALGFAGLVAALAAAQAAQWIVPLAPPFAAFVLLVAARACLHVWARFEDQRTTDAATDLPNRRAMIAAEGEGSVAVATLANLDALLAVLGAGAERDVVLRIADRLRLVSAGGCVYRVTYRLLAFRLAAIDDPDTVMAGLRQLLLQPIEVAGRRVDCAVALGLADEGEVEAQITDATMAADQALAQGRFWHRAAADRATLERQVSLMGELDAALAVGEVEVHYQPKLRLDANSANDRIVSCEALVRWRHAERGFIGPDLFIPLAEQTDRIAPLTLYVLERVIADLAGWRAGGAMLTAAVNISAKLVADAGFNAAVARLLAQGAVPGEALIFEVTESAALADPDAAAAALARYRALGVGVSMDDYGTGQSTLSYLRQLPLTELKMDRSFVQHAHVDRNDAAMVRSTIDLAHELGLKVVAEGVEEEACLAFLRGARCDLVQGYLVSRPLPPAAFAALLPPPAAAAA
jgi:EAL domain-containing protein (putative c-di-GMP-specific phosphodiesterase class I)/CHASE2 domain-containing sensor protein